MEKIYFKYDGKDYCLNSDNPELLLTQKKNFEISAESLIKNGEPKNKSVYESDENSSSPKSDEDEKTKFEIIKWKYSYNSLTEFDYVMTVKEIKPPFIEKALTSLSEDEQRNIIIFSFVAIAIPILLFVLAIINYPNPEWWWSFIGKIIRPLIAVSLAVIPIVAHVWLFFRLEHSVILQNLSAIVFVVLIFVGVGLWIQYSGMPQEFYGKPNENILYLNHLREQTTVTLLAIAGIAPWLAIILKYLGLSLLPSLITQAAKTWGKKED